MAESFARVLQWYKDLAYDRLTEIKRLEAENRVLKAEIKVCIETIRMAAALKPIHNAADDALNNAGRTNRG